jgi:3-oxoacyl-[acyl-carrier protein] reductase
MASVTFDFSGSTVLVTGGSRGIGRAIVERLAETGANVGFTYHSSEESARALCEQLERFPGKRLALKADASDASATQRVIDNVEEKLGTINGLVNNAGIKKDQALFQMEASAWRDVIETNLSGTFFMTQAVVKKMVRSGGGKIVNMTSVSGMVASPGQTNYAASKAGIIALTQSLSAEVARFDIQVNAVAPGFISTDMVDSMPDPAKKAAKQRVPARRFGEVREVADLVLFLLSPASAYVNGQTFVIDGGMTA